MIRFRGSAMGVALLALSSASCVSRAQYDRLVTEYHSESQARNHAESDLAELELTADELRHRTEAAEQRASRSGEDSQRRIDELQRRLSAAQAGVKSSLAGAEGVQVLPTEDGFRILVADHLLFDSGSTSIRTDGKAALNKIARDILSKGYQEVRIDGHTDNDPVKKTKEKFPLGNHQLAMERALSVYGYLTNVAHVPDAKLSLASFGPNRPLVRGTTPEAKARNRRVEIQVRVEPSQ